MFQHPLRYLIALGFFGVLLTDVSAQPKAAPKAKDPVAEYRYLLKEPTKDSKITEYWAAIAFELELGSYEIGARFLHSLLTVKKPTDAELVELEQQVGMAPLLRLRSVVKWSDDPNAQKQARADADSLIDQTTTAVRKFLADPVRIRKYLGLLHATPEEHQYALQQLYRSGAAVVPFAIEELRQADAEKRQTLLAALQQMGPEVLPPLAAALDSDDAVLKVDLIDLFLARAARQVAPYLWFLAASPLQPEPVRAKARTALGYFSLTSRGEVTSPLPSDKAARARELAKAISQMPAAKILLTREAEKYYRHQVAFADPNAVTIWRWDGKNVVAGWPGAPTVSAGRAEEYYGVRFAGQALALDPTYRPAQLVLVSLVLDKAYEKGGFDRPLAKAAPDFHTTLSSVNPEVVTAVLERALDEKRLPVILAATRMLGELAEVRATRPTERGEPALVRALLYPDRRVQMAAAEALLRVPGDRTALTASRIVDVFRRALAAESGAQPKVLVGYASDEFANGVAEALKGAGFEAVVVKDGRELLKRLLDASDIEAVIFDADLPGPGLAGLLGQLRGDVHVRRLPLFITPPHVQADRLIQERRRLEEQLKSAGPGARDAMEAQRDRINAQVKRQALDDLAAVERFAKVYPQVVPALPIDVVNKDELQSLLRTRLDAAVNPPLAAPELKDYAEKAVRYLARAAKGELAGLDVLPAADAVYRALAAKKLTPEGQLAAIEVVGRLPGKKPQTELLRVVLDPDDKRAAIRLAAAAELVRHVQRNSPALAGNEVRALHDAYTKSADAAYKTALAQVLGALRPDARTTGDILRGYQPKPPGAAPPPPPPPMPER